MTGGEWRAARRTAAAVILFGQNFPNFERRKVSIDIRSYTTYILYWILLRTDTTLKQSQQQHCKEEAEGLEEDEEEEGVYTLQCDPFDLNALNNSNNEASQLRLLCKLASPIVAQLHLTG